MAYSSWSVVFGEQPSAAKWNILGSNDDHFYGFLGDNLAWQSWTPTFTNLTVGNGTLVSKYTRIGNTVHFRLSLVFGSTSAMGSGPLFTPPVAFNTGYSQRQQIGHLAIEDSGTASYFGGVRVRDAASPTEFQLFVYNAGGTYATYTALTSTIPMTWTTNDTLMVVGTYETT